MHSVVQENRAVLGLANPAENVLDLKKIKIDVIPSSCAISRFWT